MSAVKKSTYYAAPILDVIDIKPDGPESFSGRVGFLIGAAARVADEACPALPIGVWRALAAANTGAVYSYEQGADPVISGVLLKLFDLGQSNQFGIDGERWSAEIRRMPFAQRFAVFEVVRRFGSLPEIVSGSPDEAEQFQKLGARLAESASI